MKKFIPSTFDPIFKAILTDPKLRDYLCYLISEVTDLNYEELYENLVIENNELQVKYAKEKFYRTDIVASIKNNKINIEANRKKTIGLITKNNAYLHSIASDKHSGDIYEENYVYQINFNEYNHFKKGNNVLDKVMPMNVETGEIEEETYQKYYINLERIRKKYYNKEKLTTFEKRCLPLVLTDKEEVKRIAYGDKMLERLYGKMKELNERKSILDMWDSEREYQKAMEMDKRIAIEKATKKATKEGLKQGSQKEKINIAKNMINKNMDINLISEITGLDVLEINKLK